LIGDIHLQSDSKYVIPVSVGCPGLLEPGVPKWRHFDVVLDDDAELIVGLRVPGVKPGDPQPVILLEDFRSNLSATLRQSKILCLSRNFLIHMKIAPDNLPTDNPV